MVFFIVLGMANVNCGVYMGEHLCVCVCACMCECVCARACVCHCTSAGKLRGWNIEDSVFG